MANKLMVIAGVILIGGFFLYTVLCIGVDRLLRSPTAQAIRAGWCGVLIIAAVVWACWFVLTSPTP